jgi:hypothetical protein
MTGAYSFICIESTTSALCARLNALGVWKWRIGDSHWYGDYVACQPFEGARIRIVDFPVPADGGWRYEADVRQARDCSTPLSVIDEAFRNALAQIGARAVTEIEWFD